jgi:hypothetical protein
LLHFIDSCSRQRSELARVGFKPGHHCEFCGDLSELAVHAPREGIIIARDTAEEGGVGMILDRLGIWLPLIAVDVQPRPGRIVKAIKSGQVRRARLTRPAARSRTRHGFRLSRRYG